MAAGALQKMKQVRVLYCGAGLYDIVIGLLFVLVAPRLYVMLGVTPPELFYVHSAGALLVLFGVMCWQIAMNPVRWRFLILYAMGVKAVYCISIFVHFSLGTLPWVWLVPGIVDLILLVGFAWSWFVIARHGGTDRI